MTDIPQHEMASAARLIAEQARQSLDAQAAGMPTTSARRWPKYLEMKAARGQQPITLAEAVEQCRAARGAQ